MKRSETVVGRAEELQRLHGEIRAAARGGRGSLFLVGDAGIGKTRLLNEAAALTAQLGMPVLRARASTVAPTAFGVVAEALRSWLRTQPPDREPRPADAFDDGLRLILPEWPARAAPGVLSPNQVRLLTYEAVVRLVREIAAPRGAVVLFDDLHDADADSIEVIRYLVTASPEQTLIVGVLRGAEGVVANDTVAALGAAGNAVVQPLARLDRDGVVDLLAALLRARPPEPLVDDVVNRTDGVPLLVEEVLDAHVRSGSVLVDRGDAHWRGGVTAVPDTVVTTVARRLERLGTSERAVIVAGAVAGEFDARLVGAVAQQPADVVDAALVHTVEQGLLETVAGRLEFRHAVLRDATIEGALPHVVAAMHERAATVLGDATNQTVPLLERRARHLDAIGRSDEAAVLLTTASHDSRAARGVLDAERLARAAIACVAEQAQRTRSDEGATSGVRAERASAAPGGASRRRAGVDGASRRRAGVDAADALAAALAAQGRWAEALAVDDTTSAQCGHERERWLRMAQCALDARLIERTRALLAEAQAIADDQCFVHVAMGRLALSDNAVDTAFACAAHAEDLAGDDPAARCAALDLRARTLEIAGHRADATHTYAAIVDVAGAAGLVDARLRALVCLTEFELFDGRPPVRMFEACEVARESGALVEQAWAELNLAIALVLHGNARAGYEVAAPAVERARSMRLDLLPFVLVARAGAESRLEDEGYNYEATLAEARSLVGDAADFEIHAGGITGDVLMRAGRYDDAVSVLQRGVAAARANAGGVPTDSACWIVFALAGAGQVEEAGRALADARSISGTQRWYASDVLLEAADALLARDAARIEAVFDSAPSNLRYELAQVRVFAADIIGSPDRTRWLREALDVYEAASMRDTADRVRRMLRDAGGAVPRARSRGRVPPALIPLGVTAREAQVLHLVAQGATNAQAAERLFISVRTVESHVSSLLTKLDASSREDLTAWADMTAE